MDNLSDLSKSSSIRYNFRCTGCENNCSSYATCPKPKKECVGVSCVSPCEYFNPSAALTLIDLFNVVDYWKQSEFYEFVKDIEIDSDILFKLNLTLNEKMLEGRSDDE